MLKSLNLQLAACDMQLFSFSEKAFETPETICYIHHRPAEPAGRLSRVDWLEIAPKKETLHMITQIGIAAGDIWHYLDEKGTATLDQLTKAIGKPRELLLMSLGWLAREGHINLGHAETGYLASLTQRK